jgi:hypothetical protein
MTPGFNNCFYLKKSSEMSWFPVCFSNTSERAPLCRIDETSLAYGDFGW